MSVPNLWRNCKVVLRWPHSKTIPLLRRVWLLVVMRGMDKSQASSILHISMTSHMSTTTKSVFIFVVKGDMVSQRIFLSLAINASGIVNFRPTNQLDMNKRHAGHRAMMQHDERMKTYLIKTALG